MEDAIVQALNHHAMRPETDYDAAHGASGNAIYGPIHPFDGGGGSGAFRALADLASCRLDGAPGEVLSCMILRTGR